MTQYLLILEHGPTSWGAYCPDLPGCVAVAETRAEVKTLYGEAIEGWVEATLEDGDPIPSPRAETETVTIGLPNQPPRSYLAILQPSPIGTWSVSAADVPDLALEYSTRGEALRLFQTALQSHLEALEAIPEPVSEVAAVTVDFTRQPVAA